MLGVTPMQAFVCVVLAVPVLIALTAGDYRQALVWLGDQRAAGHAGRGPGARAARAALAR